MTLTIVSRGEWGMPGPLGPALTLPARTLYLHHSVTGAHNGAGAVRTVANIGVTRFGRASYSYAVTLDGTCYEMQGSHIGAHTAGQNSTALAVVLVGNYQVDHPTGAQLDTVARLYRLLVTIGHLRSDAPLRGHRDAPGASTACPGRHAYAALPAVRARIAEFSASPPVSEEDDMAGAIAVRVQGQATVWVGAPWTGEAVRAANPAELQDYADRGVISRRPDGKANVWVVQLESTLDRWFPYRDRRSRVSVEAIAREVAERVHVPVPDGASADEILDQLAARLRE